MINSFIKRIRNNISAFSLLELSIVMLVISITATGLMNVAMQATSDDAEEETIERMEIIAKHIALFVKNNERIPCPANGTLSDTAALYGIEQRNSTRDIEFDHRMGTTNIVSAGVIGCNNGHGSSGNMHIGVIPTRTLNLPDEYMVDGWNKRFSYAVDTIFTNDICDGNNFTDCFRFTENGTLDIGNTQNGSEYTSEAVYIIISHGENNHGAFPKNGGSRLNLITPSPILEDENAHINGSFDNEFVYVQGNNNFDDLILYREKSHIMLDLWDNIDESVCLIAANIVENPSFLIDPKFANPPIINPTYFGDKNETCTGAGNTSDGETCQRYANYIDAVCAGIYN